MDREIITAVDDHDINMLERVLKNGADPNIKYDIPIPLVNGGYYDEYYDTNGITPLLYTLHYNNFIDRFSSFPITIEEISRFIFHSPFPDAPPLSVH